MSEKDILKTDRKINKNVGFGTLMKTLTKEEAWIDILMRDPGSDNKMLFDGSRLLIKRGQFITSIRKLSTKWKWSSTKVTAFLRKYFGKRPEMIKRESDTKKHL